MPSISTYINYETYWNVAQRFAPKFGVISLELNESTRTLMTMLFSASINFEVKKVTFLINNRSHSCTKSLSSTDRNDLVKW